jgi:signal peptidase II
MGWRAAYLLAALGIYVTDQMTKAWAVRALRFGDGVKLIDGVLHLAYAENSGIAFGQLRDTGSVGRWFFVTLAGAAAMVVLVYFFRTARNDDHVLGACALLLAGILGNMTDRVRLGFVIDFIDVYIGSYHWPTFNVADASICAGAFLLACDLFLHKESGARVKNPEASEL